MRSPGGGNVGLEIGLGGRVLGTDYRATLTAPLQDPCRRHFRPRRLLVSYLRRRHLGAAVVVKATKARERRQHRERLYGAWRRGPERAWNFSVGGRERKRTQRYKVNSHAVCLISRDNASYPRGDHGIRDVAQEPAF